MTFFTRIYLDGKHSDTHDILMRAVSALLIADGRDADISDVRTNFTPKGVKLFPHNTYTTEAETYKTVPGQGLPGIVTVKNDPKGKIPALTDKNLPNYSIPEHTYTISYEWICIVCHWPGDFGKRCAWSARQLSLVHRRRRRFLPENWWRSWSGRRGRIFR